MNMNKNEFYPDWTEEAPNKKSYRSILKWGDPNEYKHPNRRLYALMKKTFHMTDDDFKEKQETGDEEVNFTKAVSLSKDQLEYFKNIVGEENILEDSYSRLQIAYGKTMIDLMRLRKNIVENIPDIVIHPRSKEDIMKIVKYCNEERIPVYIYGGGSSVTRGVEAVKGGVTLDMRVHMKKVIKFNEINQTIKVQAGMSGPDLEKTLNDAPTII